MGSSLVSPRLIEGSKRQSTRSAGLRRAKLRGVAAKAVESLESRRMFSIVGFDVSTVPSGNTNFGVSPFPAATSDPNATVGGLTRGWTVTTGTGGAHAWGGNNFSLTATNEATAISAGDFASFTIEANAGYKESLSTIDSYNIRRSSQGPTGAIWQYSLDATNFVDIGSPITWGTGTGGSGNIEPAIDLTGIPALQNVVAGTTVTLRVVNWGALGTSGTWYINDASGAAGVGLYVEGAVTPAAVAPTVTGLNPTQGALGGGTTVTINGSAFTNTSTVSFGTGHAGTNVTYISPSQITAVSPAGSGTVDVQVTNAYGTSPTSSADQFKYTTAPVVDSLSPASGTTAGGTLVTINGQNLTGASQVTFAGSTPIPASAFVSASNTAITVHSPAASAGTVDVTVTTGGGTSVIDAGDKFTYVVPPTVTGIAPTSGADSGGTSVVITGTNFASGATVTFGGVAATSVTFTDSGHITAVAPPGTVGSVDVVVSISGVASATSPADQYTYLVGSIANAENLTSGAPVTLDDNPIVTAIVTYPGSEHGITYSNYGYIVSDGTGSTEILGVPSGSTYAPAVGDELLIKGTWAPFHGIPEVTSPTTITVLNQNVALPSTPVPNPTVSQVNTPNVANLPNNIEGYIVTLQAVDVSGLSNIDGLFEAKNLTGTITDTTGATVTLYYYPTSYSTAVQAQGGSPNLFDSPFPDGLVDITGLASVYNSGTATAPVYMPEFIPLAIATSTHAPVVSSVVPNDGPTAGGNTVTVNGYGFFDNDSQGSNVTGVSFVVGGTSTPAESYSVTSDNVLTAQPPAGLNGQVADVVVTTSHGSSAVSSADQYTYTNAPIISSMNVSAGLANSTTPQTLTITGFNFTGATSVTFGGVSASFSVVSGSNGTSITATVPANQAPGTVAVVVTGPGGVSAQSSADNFTFEAVPTITSLAPATGGESGGTSVVITGTNFIGAVGVTFGSGANATTVTTFTVSTDGTQITVTSPPSSVIGAVDVKVTTPAGSVTDSASYTYVVFNVAAAEAATSGSLITLNSNPVITAILSEPTTGTNTVNGSTYTNWSFLVQDSSGSMDVFGALPSGSTYTPTVGDTLSISGTYAPYNQIPELGTITAIAPTGTVSLSTIPAPLPETVAAIDQSTLPPAVAEYLVTLTNVTIAPPSTGPATFGTAVISGTVTDSTGSMTLYYWPTSYSVSNLNLFGQSTSQTGIDITGFVDVYAGPPASPEFIPLSITPYVPSGLPAWVASGSQATWSNETLTVTGPTTIIGDPLSSSDHPVINVASGGALTIASTSTTSNVVHIASLNVSSGGSTTVSDSSSGPTALVLSAGNSLAVAGKLDLTDGYLDLVGGSLTSTNTLLAEGYGTGGWTGTTGITSSTAKGNTSHLTGLGAILNQTATGTQLYSTFGSATTTASTDVLVRYTYVGDANLDGKIDGSDYANVDSGYLAHSTPTWFNGNFNFDTTIDGSDYTLIDNAFNRQGTAFAKPSAQLAKPAVAIAPITTTSSIDSFFSDKKVATSLVDDVQNLVTDVN